MAFINGNIYQERNERNGYIQKVRTQDYAYTWWPQGWLGRQREIYTCTGSYGMSIDTQKGYISRLGAFEQRLSAFDKLEYDNSDIESLDACVMDYNIMLDGKKMSYAGIDPAEPFNAPEGLQLDYFGVSNRILESGRYMQRIDLMYLTFQDTDIRGRMEVACNPDFFGLSLELFSEEKRPDVKPEFSITLKETYNKCTVSPDNRAVTVTDARGRGFTFYAPDENVHISAAGSSVIISGRSGPLEKDRFEGIGVLVMPSVHAEISDADKLAALEQINITAEQIMPYNGKMQPVSYDKARGYHSISADGMFSESGRNFNESNLDTYDWIRLTLENPSDITVRVPLQFFKNYPFSVTGICPMLRDSATGEPIGVPVQLTKNWHTYYHIPDNSPRRHFEGKWYHGYTLLEVPAHSCVTYDYTCTFAQWGGVYAASHAQLCLAGWGGGQQWETASIGSFGESFCYDIARSWTWCNMGDICPLGIYSRINGVKYDWTTNIGGGVYAVLNILGIII